MGQVAGPGHQPLPQLPAHWGEHAAPPGAAVSLTKRLAVSFDEVPSDQGGLAPGKSATGVGFVVIKGATEVLFVWEEMVSCYAVSHKQCNAGRFCQQPALATLAPLPLGN
ncbi:hypothetical protein HaLaN_18504 [Haematococcus lacustris]|uniref:Uncharacterized protein n=1 Tax=Haematococcus lacustris TaxID=44745 RepID=A0A699ZFB4_HAELA|nr:hypothetical protein HaLaN_18504 [Haematococcus lacustris]